MCNQPDTNQSGTPTYCFGEPGIEAYHLPRPTHCLDMSSGRPILRLSVHWDVCEQTPLLPTGDGNHHTCVRGITRAIKLRILPVSTRVISLLHSPRLDSQRDLNKQKHNRIRVNISTYTNASTVTKTTIRNQRITHVPRRSPDADPS